MKNLYFVLVGLLLVPIFLSCATTPVILPDDDTAKISEDLEGKLEKAGITQNDVRRYVDECISLLGNPIPDGFKLIAPNIYQAIDDNDYRILIGVNNEVIASSFSAALSKRENANRLNELFFAYFENNNWQLSALSNNNDQMYSKDGVYTAMDVKQEMRDDGHVVTYVLFTKDYSFFTNNFIIKN